MFQSSQQSDASGANRRLLFVKLKSSCWQVAAVQQVTYHHKNSILLFIAAKTDIRTITIISSNIEKLVSGSLCDAVHVTARVID